MTQNPVLDHLLELRGTLVRAMRAKKVPADMYNESRRRIADLDASLAEMGYDVKTEVQVRDEAKRKPAPLAVKRHIKRRMRNKEDSFTAKLRRHFGGVKP